jgi:hypothetical protein
MSNQNGSIFKTLILITAGITGSVTIVYVLKFLIISYFIYKTVKGKKPKKPVEIVEQEEITNNVNDISHMKKEKDMKKIDFHIKSPLEVTTSISLEVIKRPEFVISKQANIEIEKVKHNRNELPVRRESIIDEEADYDLREEKDLKDIKDAKTKIKQKRSSDLGRKTSLVSVHNKRISQAKEYKEEIGNDNNIPFSRFSNQIQAKESNSPTSPGKEKISIPTLKKFSLKNTNQANKSFEKDKENFINNNTIIDIVNDLKNVENLISDKVKKYAVDHKLLEPEADDDLNLNNQQSLLLPVFTHEFNDEVEVDFDPGYLEDEDDELFEDLPQLLSGGSKDITNSKKEVRTGKSNLLNKELKYESIQTIEELNIILNSKYKSNNIIYKIATFEINGNEIIESEMILQMLKHLYTELNSGLIEMGDNFLEQRRKYFLVDHDTYVSIINLFLRKKEEYFLAVFNELMSKLDISQELMDNTYAYYLNIDDPDYDKVKEAFEKIYKAGAKRYILSY